MTEMRPKLLDLFCGAGGAAMGYYRAGFDVVGVDIKPMPRYPFEFHQADALEYCAAHGAEFDAIHASPPCQHYSEATPHAHRINHPDLIGATRDIIKLSRVPYVIENVEMARNKLVNPVMLCGSMFGLQIFRHRYFELDPFWILSPMMCKHDFDPVLITGQNNRGRFCPTIEGKRRYVGDRNLHNSIEEKRRAIDISWMTITEITQAIPPAYTEFIGKHLLEYLSRINAT